MRSFVRDSTFEVRHSRRGTYLWAWALFSPHGAFCQSPSPTLLWSVCVVLPVMLGLGITEIVFRNALPAEDLGRYGGKADWTLDLGYVVWLMYVVFNVLRAVFAVIYIRLEDDKMRDPSRPQPALAVVARAAYSISVPGLLVLLVVYVGLATRGHRMHAHTSAFYATNACFALVDLVFFEVHIQFEHVVWALALGWMWVLPISFAHYALADSETRRPYVYGCADWGHPLASLGYIIAISILTVCVYAIVAAFCDWRHGRPGCNVYVLPDYNNDADCAEESAVADADAEAGAREGMGLGMGMGASALCVP